MPENKIDTVSKEWLQTELRLAEKNLIILDCRSYNEYIEGHIRSAVNFSIPSIMLRRLAAGKIDIISTIKCHNLKQKIQTNYKICIFVLYNGNNGNKISCKLNNSNNSNLIEYKYGTNYNTSNSADNSGHYINLNNIYNSENRSSNYLIECKEQKIPNTTNQLTSSINCVYNDLTNTSIINVLHRRLKQDGCHVVCLQDSFSSFRDTFPEWCEDENISYSIDSGRNTSTDQLMGLRSLRISTPHSDSACSSSTESSDCESSIVTKQQINEAPIEIVPGLFLGNALHSGDSMALQKYNIKYVLNVTPDLPNVFEASGGIQYLQIPITDHYSQDLAVHFPTAIHFIEEAHSKGSAVLVHCLAGVSRSVTVTLAYLMHTRSLCLNDAFSLVRDRKPDVSPNFHFMEQLHSFERQLRISPNRAIASHSGTPTAISQQQQQQQQQQVEKSKEFENYSNEKIFTCNCIQTNCKCIEGSYIVNLKNTGVSPDSGIEFDRWTPSDTGHK